MELIPLRYGYHLNIGRHQILLTRQDLDTLVRLLTDDGAQASNVGGKRRHTKKSDFLAMDVGQYIVLRLTNKEMAKVCSTLTRCKREGTYFSIQVVGGRKMPREDMGEDRDYLITRLK